MGTDPKDRVYLGELARELDRREGTIRGWEADGILPKKLLPKRDERGWRYWTKTQVKQIREWMVRAKRIPGAGLRNYNPTPKQVGEILERMRAPRPDRRQNNNPEEG